jgi:hypothetical protein
MQDEEFVKLKHWIDAEFTVLHVYLAVILGFLVHRRFIWVVVVVYVIISLIYAASRFAYVESKHKGYLKIPKL